MKSSYDQIQDAIRGMLKSGVAERLFPGAVAAISVGGSAPLFAATGAHTYENGAQAVGSETLFDMASLTKVLVTTTAVLQMVEQGRLSLSDPVGTYVTSFRGGGKDDVTVFHLLTHTSGLRADLDLGRLGGEWSRITPDDLWDAIARGPLPGTPGAQYVYSDLGFLLLGRIVEIVSGSTLDVYAAAHIFGPLGMVRTRYCPPPEWRPETAPTEFDARWRGGPLQGQVHDEKAFLLGGVAGHAGLFSTAEDVHCFLGALLDCLSGDSGFVLGETLARAMTQNQTPNLAVLQGLGWFLDGAFLGDLRPDAFGHTGFTGVSVAVDPTRDITCLLLTNCVYPTRPDAETRRRLNDIRTETTGLARQLATKA